MSGREVNAQGKLSGRVVLASGVAGAWIGALQGLVGYIPRLNSLLMMISGALVGAVIAAILGLLLYLLAFRGTAVFAVIRSVAWVAGVCGVLSSLAIRWWTFGEGAVLSMLVTPVVAVICAATIRTYIAFSRTTETSRESA